LEELGRASEFPGHILYERIPVPRFTKEETEVNRRAREVLKSPSSTPEEKASARKAIERLNLERSRRIEARKSAGVQPSRKDYETEEQYKVALQEYWAKLDRAVAEREALKVLNDPSSSTLVRTRAYERLGLEPPEALRNDQPIPESPEENRQRANIHRLSDSEIAEERRREQKFYDEIAEMLAAEKAKEQHP
jgi:hypothetical protein